MDRSRQSFLGPNSDDVIQNARIAVVGLCGGGSHVAQQLAHIGFGDLQLIDHDHADDTNINRMVGLTAADVENEAAKTDVIYRLVKGINPKANVQLFPMRWQQCADRLRDRTAIFGCVDSFVERDQLERFARRFMIPYIDIGMDVTGGHGSHVISGQVILSLPGHACMHCMGFLTEEIIAEEAKRYGNAGGKPQVVWPNGTLASVALGQFMSLLIPWNTSIKPVLYLDYDGNRMTVGPNKRLIHINEHSCRHFQGPDSLGEVLP